MNQVIEAIKARRSARVYTDKQVPREALEAILETATYAPNGMHLETWHFTAVRNADKLAELNTCVRAAFAKSDNPRMQERGNNASYCCYYHAPTLIIASNEPTHPWAGQDCACAMENMFVAATSLGIASCWINQVGQTCEDPAVKEYLTSLGVPADHKVYGCVALGYLPEHAPMKEKSVKPGTVTIVD